VENTDRADIIACLNGDEESYRKIVKRYETDIAKLMWRFSRERSVCEELVQDVFVEAYFSLGGYKGLAPFDHWLKRIASRVGYKYWRRRGNERAKLSLDDIVSEDMKEAPAKDEHAGEVVYRLLSWLKPSERLVLTLIYIEGCNAKEVADRMGWNEGVVRMRAHRAKRKLKEIAEKHHLLERYGWIL
jgi:RNA polymerase sigma-70 factor (ECF subfamily)